MSRSEDALPGLYLIYLRGEPGLLLSKHPYRNWREIQDEYPDYQTSLGPWSADEIVDFFASDFGDPSRWPFSAQQVQEFAASDEMVLSHVPTPQPGAVVR